MNSKQRFWDSRPVILNDLDEKKELVLNLMPENIDKILDVACGDGLTLTRIDAKEKYGIDINKENVKRSKKRGIKASQRDVEERFPYRNNFFDIIMTEGLFQHLYDPELTIKEIKRVLKPGGFFIGSIPNNYHIIHRISYILAKPHDSFLFRDRAAQISSSFFTLKSFRELIGKYFEVEICTGRVGKFSRIWPSMFGMDIFWKAKKL